jgi:hypothetical protein
MLAIGAVALGARCIENVHVYVDQDGYTHVTGIMYNDTDVQGVGLTLRATLFDNAGNVIAQKDGPPCPPDTQPNSQIMFDLRFDNPGVPPHARAEVRLVAGQALPAPLPNPDIVVLEREAARFEGVPPIPGLGISDSDVLFFFGIRNRSNTAYPIQGCAAVVDNQSNIIAADVGELIELDANDFPVPAVLDPQQLTGVFFPVSNVPRGPVQIRAWLWFGPKDAPTSAYQYVEVPLTTIQVIDVGP